MATFAERFKQALELRNMKQSDIVENTKIGKSSVSTYLTGAYLPKQENTYKIAKALNVNEAWLMGYDVPMERTALPFVEPDVTEDYVTFPIIGHVAAGYDHLAVEEWDGDKIDIPVSYLRNRPKADYFVLRVSGDSMYPLYIDGDIVLVLKQNTLERSGDIGVILYGGEKATVKKVEYVMGEDWMKLIPLNPNYPPINVRGSDLEECKVLGIPKLLIRELK